MEFAEQTAHKYAKLREGYTSKKINLISLGQARANALNFPWESYTPPRPRQTGIIRFHNYSLAEIRNYIDWTFYFFSWDINGRYPAILNDPVKGPEATRLYRESNLLLDEIVGNNLLRASGVVGLFPASSHGDDIVVYADEARTEMLTTLCQLRNQEEKEEGVPTLSFRFHCT